MSVSARGVRKGSPTRGGGVDMFATPSTPRENLADSLDLLVRARVRASEERVADTDEGPGVVRRRGDGAVG